MSNRIILERLLVDIDEYDKNRRDRDAFAQRVYESIEALERIPYSVHQQGRDWQYKIETEGYSDEEGFESEIAEVIPKLKAWVGELIQTHSKQAHVAGLAFRCAPNQPQMRALNGIMQWNLTNFAIT